jgi:glycosyltransferase involved in cell wall biosynthesis
VEALGLSGHVTFMGLRADGQQIIGALDVMVLPSFSEGMPNVLLEAIAYGTPVVATRVGGVPDMVSDGRSGWLVPAGDAGRSLLRFRRRSKTGPRRNDGSLGRAASWRRASPSRSRPTRGCKP